MNIKSNHSSMFSQKHEDEVTEAKTDLPKLHGKIIKRIKLKNKTAYIKAIQPFVDYDKKYDENISFKIDTPF